ncbi:MAG: tRNA uridine-5-carboxymethylaminomethyl(34) synthesis GTPase MnmE [Fidelibacterota bacterium]
MEKFSYFRKDTIAAISTPRGEGGIAIVRMSGSNSFSILKRIFVTKSKNLKPGYSTHGRIVEPSTGETIDEVIVHFYKSPNSYTTEDVAEINCHGGIYVSTRILHLLLKEGARLSNPGEFTFRAFINSRIDLAQAEAVADLIRARTKATLKVSMEHLEGELSRKIKGIKDKIVHTTSILEMELDFLEDEIDFTPENQLIKNLSKTLDEIENLLDTYEFGKICREGALVAIVGPPNSGKSSLLNTLLKEERAIVTDIPGTTRDTIEESIEINGVWYRLVDTAGIRQTRDLVEKMGLQRTERYMEKADLIILIIDCSKDPSNEEYEFLKRVGEKNFLIALNKIDLCRGEISKEIYSLTEDKNFVRISALKRWGIKELADMIFEKTVGSMTINHDSLVITKLRHREALENARKSLKRAIKSLSEKVPSEYVTVDLRESLNFLGEIIGEVTTEDILNNIFSRFCIGK